MYKKSASEILTDAGMSSRSSFYSGRGAMVCDLGYKELTKIAELIEKDHGADAKAAFVKMVAAMGKMSASAFIENLYLLERNGWEWPDSPVREEHFPVDCEGAAFGAFAGAMFGQSDRDETPAIRDRFLSENGVRPEGRFREGRDYYSGFGPRRLGD
jgi:hypothetical protein